MRSRRGGFANEVEGFMATAISGVYDQEFLGSAGAEAYRPTAEGARQALNLLRAEASLDWTMLSPAAMISPGRRTGVFRLGGDQLLADSAGNSAISVEDYALAMIDELERPAHRRQRFTLAY